LKNDYYLAAMPIVAPSLLSANFLNLQADCDLLNKRGADIITVHAEACIHLHRTVQQIKELGIKAGIALNPHTPVASLANVIKEIDLVCLMSVNPGFGGQQFIPATLPKISELKKMITETNSSALIEIDGGVTLENAPAIVEAGANVLVAGNTVFKSKDPLATIASLKRIAS